MVLATGEVVGWESHDGVRPALGFGESLGAIAALHEHEGFRAALAARGITDLGKVQVDPWPTAASASPPRRADGWPAASASTGRSPATTATPARSRACRRSSTWRPARC